MSRCNSDHTENSLNNGNDQHPDHVYFGIMPKYARNMPKYAII